MSSAPTDSARLPDGQARAGVLRRYRDRLPVSDATPMLYLGEGETPLKEILQLMRKNKWMFPADIELEYRIPEGSSAVAEVAKCVQYCKNALA